MRITLAPGVQIDEGELVFTFARSSGPGGQNVNKVNTAVTVWWDVRRSPSLFEVHRARVLAAYPRRIGTDGRLRVTSQRFRTQAANRRAAVERLIELVTASLRPRTPRKRTKPSRASSERRLLAKRLRSQRKQERRRHSDAS